jgi:hypothetical protein
VTVTDDYCDRIHRKGRHATVSLRRARLAAIVHAENPMTVRQVYYAAVTEGIITKDTGGSRQKYGYVMEDLVFLRKEEFISFEWITSVGSRRLLEWEAFVDVRDAIDSIRWRYTESPWEGQDRWMLVLTEDRGTAGSLESVASRNHVPLAPVAGWGAIGSIYEIARTIHGDERPVDIIVLGDFDPSGLYIPDEAVAKIESYRRFFSGAGCPEIRVHRIAIDEIQARDFLDRGLDHPLNPKDSRTERLISETGFTTAVELQAFPPSELRAMLSDKIDELMPEGARDETAERIAAARLKLTEIAASLS